MSDLTCKACQGSWPKEDHLPHIHWHVIPRLASDPGPLEPVWRVQHEPLLYSGLDLQSRVERLQQAIQHAR